MPRLESRFTSYVDIILAPDKLQIYHPIYFLEFLTGISHYYCGSPCAVSVCACFFYVRVSDVFADVGRLRVGNGISCTECYQCIHIYLPRSRSRQSNKRDCARDFPEFLVILGRIRHFGLFCCTTNIRILLCSKPVRAHNRTC